MSSRGRTAAERLILFVAEGFGTGRSPVAPGTVGTLVGFGWIYLLLLPGNLWFFVIGTMGGFFAAVWLGGMGEKITKLKDPGSIVIDEIAALPMAFSGAVLAHCKAGKVPAFGDYLHGQGVLILLVTFAGFRFFDITKPWLIGRAQNLPGGWGLVVDDFAAALPVAVLTYFAARLLT